MRVQTGKQNLHCILTLGDRGKWVGDLVLPGLSQDDTKLSPDHEPGACSLLCLQGVKAAANLSRFNVRGQRSELRKLSTGVGHSRKKIRQRGFRRRQRR